MPLVPNIFPSLAVQYWAWYSCTLNRRKYLNSASLFHTILPHLAVQHWAWQAGFPPLRNDYQGKKRRLSCALLPPYKLIISPSICFFSLRSHNGVTFSIFSRALLISWICLESSRAAAQHFRPRRKCRPLIWEQTALMTRSKVYEIIREGTSCRTKPSPCNIYRLRRYPGLLFSGKLKKGSRRFL